MKDRDCLKRNLKLHNIETFEFFMNAGQIKMFSVPREHYVE